MATVFTHAFVALAAGGATAPKGVPLRFWPLAMFCSAAPDLDVLLFHVGVEYGDLWGHRGMTHSLSFAAALAVIVVLLAFRKYAPFPCLRWWGLVAFFFLLTASHGAIDAFTDGGLGIAFFSPFDQTRYFMPWTPVAVSPIGLRSFFSAWGGNVLISEMIWVWGPAIVLAIVLRIARSLLRSPSPQGRG